MRNGHTLEIELLTLKDNDPIGDRVHAKGFDYGNLIRVQRCFRTHGDGPRTAHIDVLCADGTTLSITATPKKTHVSRKKIKRKKKEAGK